MDSHQHLIGIAQMKTSSNPADILVAPNLGSCLGIAVYDPENKRGGVVHCLLPLSKADPTKAAQNPFMYVDTGFARLLEEILAGGTPPNKLVIAVAGGANINDENNVFEIGKKNYTVLKKLLWKNNLLLKGESVGSDFSRTISLAIGNGCMSLKAQGKTVEL